MPYGFGSMTETTRPQVRRPGGVKRNKGKAKAARTARRRTRR